VIRIAVLASGGGTNLQALLDGCAAGRIDGRIEVVLSNVPDAWALDRARQAGVATEVLPSRGITDREAYDARLVETLQRHRPDLVCLAGYMRLLGPRFLRAFAASEATRGCPRVMNIHPALLPAFPGASGVGDAFAYGVKVTGVTVHFADESFDNGPIIAQEPVIITRPGNDSSTRRPSRRM
jgi:phosphoribosylglycinamide formyltransferase-1